MFFLPRAFSNDERAHRRRVHLQGRGTCSPHNSPWGRMCASRGPLSAWDALPQRRAWRPNPPSFKSKQPRVNGRASQTHSAGCDSRLHPRQAKGNREQGRPRSVCISRAFPELDTWVPSRPTDPLSSPLEAPQPAEADATPQGSVSLAGLHREHTPSDRRPSW